MPLIKILPHAELCPEGSEFEVSSGSNLCRSLLANGIEIEHACEMVCACTTCHVVIQSGFNSLNELKDNEEDLLDMAWGLTNNSRLACQVIIAQEDLAIEIPKYTINLAKEN